MIIFTFVTSVSIAVSITVAATAGEINRVDNHGHAGQLVFPAETIDKAHGLFGCNACPAHINGKVGHTTGNQGV